MPIRSQRKKFIGIALAVLILAACGKASESGTTQTENSSTAFATPNELLVHYYNLVKAKDFDSARNLILPGAIQDQWFEFEDSYKKNLRELRSFKIGASRPSDFGAYGKSLFDATRTEVELDVSWKREISTRNGIIIRFVAIGRLTPDSPLRIFAEDSGP